MGAFGSYAKSKIMKPFMTFLVLAALTITVWGFALYGMYGFITGK